MFNIGTKVWYLNGTKIECGVVSGIQFELSTYILATYDNLINGKEKIRHRLTYKITNCLNNSINKNYNEVFSSKEMLIMTLEGEIQYAKPLELITCQKEISLKELFEKY